MLKFRKLIIYFILGITSMMWQCIDIGDSILFGDRISDDDNVTLTIYDSTGTEVNTFPYNIQLREGGPLQDMYQVSLSDVPTADVNVTISMVSTRASVALAGVPCTSNTCNLTFTTTDWNVSQVLTLTLTDDAINQGPDEEMIPIAHSLSSGDTRFDGINLNNVMLSLFDDDSPAILFYDASAAIVSSFPHQITLNEAGALTGSYQIALQTLPSADVNIAINLPTSDARISMDLGGAVCNLNTCNLTFTSVNWDTPQIINFTLINDLINQNDLTLALDHTTTSIDPDYNGLSNNTDVLLRVADDDSPAILFYDASAAIISSFPHQITLNEAGTLIGSYQVALQTLPSADVNIAINLPTSDARISMDLGGSVCNLNTCNLTFTSVNWDTPQIINFTLINDLINQNDLTLALDHTTTSTDIDYNGLNNNTDILLIITDDDTPGFNIYDATSTLVTSLPHSITLDEHTTNQEYYFISLKTQPTADVTINFTVPADSRLTGYVNGIPCPVTGCEVILTSVTWSAPAILEFALASDDIDQDPSGNTNTYNITHTLTSTDTDYNGQSFDVSLTLEDDD